MQTLLQTLHTELGFELPRAYQAILLAFEQWYAGELANGQEVSFDALPPLLQPFTPNHQNHQRLQQFFLDSAHKYPAGIITTSLGRGKILLSIAIITKIPK